VTDHPEQQPRPSAPMEPKQETPPSPPPRLGTVTTDPFTILKKGAGPDGAEKRPRD